jgi:adenosylcobinamide-GDP ribazoletransferase
LASAKSKPLAERIGVRGLAIGAAWCIAPLGIAVLAQGAGFVIMALLFSGLALWSMQRLFARRLQGFTGDCLGATQQVCEIAFYLGAAVGLRLA